MRLISLELNGFKSFAQKTKIEFMTGMTGIVGPNGSGKSNIIEAIRWVMGEQSAKDLRGGKMTDIIFAGSATRKPLNRAEVSITFDNHDHYLASDYTEIKITRRLYRSGESQYLINGNECRLKDVLDLFMDSGLGRESFSIISQGRVEAIFNGKPEDRRAVIEEVAGVAKYKKNKDTAQKRLGETNDNLHRVNDIINELETQMEPLAQQSALAKDYQEQKSRFDQLDKTKTVIDIEKNQHQLTDVATRLANAKKLSVQYDDQTKESSQTLNELKQQQNRLNVTKDKLQNDLLVQTKQIADLSNAKNISNERKNNEAATLTQIKTRLAQVKQQLTDNQAKLSDWQQQQQEQASAIKTNQNALQQLKEMSVEQRQQQLSQQIEKLQSKQVDQMQKLTTVHNQKTYLTHNHEQDQKRQSQASIELQTNEHKTQQLNEQQEQLQLELKQQHSVVDEINDQLATAQSHRQQLQTQYEQKQKQWYQSLGQVQTVQARINSFKSLEADYAGFYQGVRYVLQHRQKFAGLKGPVSELLNVPASYTTAIETVLGGQLQNLVVDNQQSGKQIINFLVANRAGRATILPLDTLIQRNSNQTLLHQLMGLTGLAGLASELVQTDPKFQSLLNYLLSNTLIADNLDHATLIAKQSQHRFRVVTLDGQLINASGAMTGGANKQQRQGLLTRQQSQQELEVQIKDVQAKSTELENQVGKYDTAIQTNKQLIEQLQAKLEQQRSQLQTVTSKADLLQNEQKMNQRQVSALEFEVKQQTDEHATFAQQITENEQQEKKITSTIEALKVNIQQSKVDLQALQENASAQAEQIHDKEQWLAVATEKLQQISRQMTDLNEAIANDEQSIQQMTQETDATVSSQTDQAQQGQQAADQLVDLQQVHEQTNQQLGHTNDSLTALSEKIEAANQQQQRLQELQRAALDELNEVNARHVKLESLIDQGMNRLAEQYAMTLTEAKQDLSELEPAEITTQLKLLKRGLDEIGTVNLGSIEEYERVSTRYTFLHDQQTDLLNSQQQLNETMQEMDQEVITRFETSFHQVADAFAKIFVEMFGGGQAKLVLTEPDNLLTSGIDIIAQPPGKKNQQMSLLSGGERALTAITLLFSILAVRPVPFSILDETEAALDEANVNRFAHYLSTYGDDGPQFIVVTHRKGTMMNAKVLYGVTMQESGVSKMVSVSLEDVNAS